LHDDDHHDRTVAYTAMYHTSRLDSQDDIR
jgi:hypothetical protein